MNLVFKIVGSPNPVLVGNTNFKEHFSGVNTSMAWADLSPAIRQATEKFVLPYIGEELYNDLAAKYQAGTALTVQQAKVLELLQDCIAFYAIYHILPEKNMAVTSAGNLQNTPEGGSTPTPQWGWKAARWNALENGDTFLDRMLIYLEKQVKADVSYFDLYKNSAAYKVKTSDFFKDTMVLDDYLNIQQSRRSFISLVRFIKQVEEDVILPFICTDLYAVLIGETALSAANAKLIPLIRKVVAYLGAYEAIPHHRIAIDGDGFRVVSQTDTFDDRRNMTNNVHANAIQALQDRCQKRGQEALKKLGEFLEKNIADYPLYRDSDCRTAPVQKGNSIIQSPDGIGAVHFG